MPRTQLLPRLARSACRTVQHLPTDAPETAKTITNPSKTIHQDRAISRKTLGCRPTQPVREKSPAELFSHRPDWCSNRASTSEQNRTSPNAAAIRTNPGTIWRHAEKHRRNLPKSAQTWTNLDIPGHQTRQFPAHSAKSARSPQNSPIADPPANGLALASPHQRTTP